MNRLTYLMSILLITATGFAQGHFVAAFTGNGQDQMNIFLVSATIEGVNLEAGDEIAAFDGTICCGKVVLSQPININDNSSYIDIKASRKEDGQSNGYTIKNTITYKFWDSSENSEISGITAEYFDPSTGLPTYEATYKVSGSAFVKLSVADPVKFALSSNSGLDQSNRTTGIYPFTNDSGITIYPNPSRGNIHIKFTQLPETGTSIIASDITGKIIYKKLAVNNEVSIDLKENPPGVYFIRIDQKIPGTYKIILE